MSSDDRRFLTVQEVADELRVSKRSIYRALEGGELPHIRIGSVIRIPAQVLDWRRHDGTDALLTVDEAAEYLRVDRSTIYRLEREGRLQSVRVRRRRRFRLEELHAYLGGGR